MPRRWTTEEEEKYRSELVDLYVAQNKSLRQTATILDIKEQTVFRRLARLGIPTMPHRKLHYLNRRNDIKIPGIYSKDLAEFFGIMLGDGHISHFQISVHLGTKEAEYAEYVRALITKLFHAPAKIAVRSSKYRDIYLGSTAATAWLLQKGLVGNKVKAQVCVPRWIFLRNTFLKGLVRGFFDTDGSVYKLKFGIQIAFTNYSIPLLEDLQKALAQLQYTPSDISGPRFYLTKRSEVKRFFSEIGPKNPKHRKRFYQFLHAPVG
ncbi:MAG: hypothetical protein HYU81_00570 [Candidatus Brennerbacteria bacterium]|nr:hypothetical protein [Candidatus Brennerbacteria bacterium]